MEDGRETGWGKMGERKDVGLRIKDFSHNARSYRLLPLYTGIVAYKEGSLSGNCR